MPLWLRSSLASAVLPCTREFSPLCPVVCVCASCSRTEMPRDDSVETRQPLVDCTATQMHRPLADYRAFALAVLLLAGIFLPAVCSAEDLGHWWSDPCDKLRKVRHEGSQEVHTQLKNVISNLKNDLLKLKRIFKTVCTHPYTTFHIQYNTVRMSKVLTHISRLLQTIPVPHPIPKHPWLNNAKFKREMKKQKNKDNVSDPFLSLSANI